MNPSISTYHRGLLTWEWEARAELTKPLHIGSCVYMPVPGLSILVKTGTAPSRRSAIRRAQRALRNV
jgi:hypothetical protein